MYRTDNRVPEKNRSVLIDEQYLRLMFDTVDDLLLIFSKRGELMYCNKAVSVKTGYSKNKLETMHILDFYSREQRAQSEKLFGELLAEGHGTSMLPILRSDGSLLHAESTMCGGTWQGEPCIFVVSRDLSGTRFSPENAVVYFKNSPAMMVILKSPELLFFDINRAFENRFGYRPEDLVGFELQSIGIYSGADAGSAAASAPDLKANMVFELTVEAKNGEKVRCLVYGNKIRSDKQSCILVTLVEQTDLAGYRSKLLEKSRLMQLLLECSSELFGAPSSETGCVIDRTLEGIGRHFRVDRAYVFGVDEENGVMSNTHEWCADGVQPVIDMLKDLPLSFYPEWMKKLKNNEDIRITDVRKLPDSWAAEKKILAEQFVGSVFVTPVTYGGCLYGFMGFDSVGTSAKWEAEACALLRFFAKNIGAVWFAERTRSELHSARRTAELANREKTGYLTNISHGIRTQMNTVIGSMNLLMETPLNSRQRKYAEAIVSSGKAMLDIVNSVLDISKIESGNFEVEYSQFLPGEVLDEVEHSFAYAVARKGLSLNIDVDPSVPVFLAGDEVKLRQILSNIVSNAVKYTESGDIHIHVNCGAAEEGSCRLRFAVADRGPGVDERELPHLFEAFRQIVPADAQSGGGLSLALCKYYSEKMGGSIRAENREGGGAVITFELPFDIVNIESCGQFSFSLKPGDRVLIVDTDSKAKAVLQKFLQSFSLLPVEADSEAGALALLEDAAAGGAFFNLCFIGRNLADGSGTGLVKKIREKTYPAKNFILLAEENDPLAQQIRDAASAFDGVVTKPLRITELLKELTLYFGENCASCSSGKLGMRKFKNTRILVADDVEINREIVKSILSGFGIEADLACNGREAVEMFGSRPYEAVLMDIQMPEMDGFEATAAIRAIERDKKRTPVIALTAHAMGEIRERCLQAGMDEHLIKPVAPEVLYEALVHFIPGKPGTRPAAAAKHVPSGQKKRSAQSKLLDPEAGLRSVGGDRGVYTEMLRKYEARYLSWQREPYRIFGTMKSAELALFFHRMKSESGQIGAPEIMKTAGELEQILQKSGEGRAPDLAARYEAFVQRHKKLMDEIQRIQKTGEYTEGEMQKRRESGDLSALHGELSALSETLLDHDPLKCRGHMSRLRSLDWPEAVRELLDELSKRINRYDFEGALHLAQEGLGISDTADGKHEPLGGHNDGTEKDDPDC